MADWIRQSYPDAEIQWRPFLLRPDMPPEGMELSREYKDDMADARRRLARAAADVGLPIAFSDHVPNSRRALEATEYAKQQGEGEEFHRAVFAARYGEGSDISEWEVLRQAAVKASLDPDDMERQTGSGRFREDVEVKAGEAREMGIHAIPTFVINDRCRIVGFQPFEVFRRAIEEITGQE
ncbi:MAG: DsbA family protein [Thermoleophilia bacterium]|nr:DsbA family protein [Thermoleophilia bacterium]